MWLQNLEAWRGMPTPASCWSTLIYTTVEETRVHRSTHGVNELHEKGPPKTERVAPNDPGCRILNLQNASVHCRLGNLEHSFHESRKAGPFSKQFRPIEMLNCGPLSESRFI
ncbi:hypothetical protein CDAR_78411 [Caerostris darwini]|uniref:Uncharacterized protein n=1 Tax=Caerostris darwini TaxID=1538125 RepID=A0AAV4SI55_9ARAC|nr:hypothetical protein CDAR_78411 [Caerostris darwini]